MVVVDELDVVEVVELLEDGNVDVVDCVEKEASVEVEDIEELSESVSTLLLFLATVILVGHFLSAKRRQIWGTSLSLAWTCMVLSWRITMMP